MARAHRQIRACGHRVPQLSGDLGRMLQVRVDHGQHLATGSLPAADHGGGKSFLTAAAHHAERRVLSGELEGERPGLVGAVVVDDDQLVGAVQARLEDGGELADQLRQIVRLLVSRDDERQFERRRAPLDAQRA